MGAAPGCRPRRSVRAPRRVAAAVALCALIVCTAAKAVGLGEIQVQSGLNEPFAAQVPLRGLEPGEMDELRVALAPDEAFRREGLKRSWLLTRLTFTPVATGERTGFVRIASRDHFREPSLSFIIEVSARDHVVQRRYDVLLNLK